MGTMKWTVILLMTYQLLGYGGWACRLEKVEGDDSKYTTRLWGKRVIRSCTNNEKFSPDQCRCVMDLKPDPIHGGERIPIRKAPWVVSIKGVGKGVKLNGRTKFDDDDYTTFCGGALIAARWVTTARHCVDESQYQDLWVVAGGSEVDVSYPTDDDRYAQQSQFDVMYEPTTNTATFYPNGTEKERPADFALLHLKVAIEENNNIKYIALGKTLSDFYDRPCYVAGWGCSGYYENGRFRESIIYHGGRQPNLKELKVRLLPDDDDRCKDLERNERYQEIIEQNGHISSERFRGEQICTVEYTVDKLPIEFSYLFGPVYGSICQGDSGGPVYCDDFRTINWLDRKPDPVLLGIVSNTYSDIQAGLPSFSANIPLFYDFIVDTMKAAGNRP